MSQKSLIDELVPWCKGWSRIGTNSLQSMIQKGMDELFDYDAPYMIYLDTDNVGFPPYLETVADTTRYDIIPANFPDLTDFTRKLGGVDYSVNCRNVSRVFIDASDTDTFNRWQSSPGLYYSPNLYTTVSSRIRIVEVPCQSYARVENTPAFIQFPENPESSTDRYFCEFTWEPPRLVSENIPLPIPPKYERAIRDFVIGEIQFLMNGQPNKMQTKFEEYWVPEFRNEMAEGSKTTDLKTIPILLG